MAYLLNEEEDELNRPAGSGGAGLASVGSVGPTQVNNPSGPSRFINFSSYFNANRGAAEAAGNSLVSGLESKAQGAQAGAQKAQTDVATQATANTLKGPEAGVRVEIPMDKGTHAGTVSLEDAKKKGETKYTGPTAESVNTLFGPLSQQAATASRELAQTGDAAGVKALRGGTGFDAQLANTAAGGRLEGLRKKYGNVSNAVADSKALATGAASAAQGTTEASAAAYKGMANSYETKLKGESTRRANKQTAQAQLQDARKRGRNLFQQTFGEEALVGGGVGAAIDSLSLPALQELEALHARAQSGQLWDRAAYAKRMMELINPQKVHVVGQG